MDYYNQLLELVQNYAGLPIGGLLALDKATCYYISHLLIFFTAAFALTQILALLSGGGTARIGTSGGDSHKSGLNTALSQGGRANKKRKVRPNLLLICGATNSGKTALFYHLLTKEVRSTVTSIEINETSSSMEVKIPSAHGGEPSSIK